MLIVTVIKFDNITSNSFEYTKGVKQGCILLPELFSVYGEYIIRANLNVGMVMLRCVQQINNLRFADNIAPCTQLEEEMKNC